MIVWSGNIGKAYVFLVQTKIAPSDFQQRDFVFSKPKVTSIYGSKSNSWNYSIRLLQVKIISEQQKTFFVIQINHNKCKGNNKRDEDVGPHLIFQFKKNLMTNI